MAGGAVPQRLNTSQRENGALSLSHDRVGAAHHYGNTTREGARHTNPSAHRRQRPPALRGFADGIGGERRRARPGHPRRPPPAGATAPAIAPTPSPAAVDPAELELPLQGIAARPDFVTADDGLQPLRTWSTGAPEQARRRGALGAGRPRFRAGRFGSPGDQLAGDAALVSSPGG